MTNQHQSNASTAATRAVTKLLATILLLACIVIVFMAMHIGSLNKRLADNNKAWVAAAKPVSDARTTLPAIKSPEDLANALDASYQITPVKTGVTTPNRETEIVIRPRRTLGELLEEDERFHEMIKKKPSF